MARTPTRIGRYDLISPLAAGGMGRIYLARTTSMGGFVRKVVIKALEMPTTSDDDPAISMFLDEARLMGLLHHQHIAGVYDIARDGDDGVHYMVLEYIDGFSAHEVWERSIQLGVQLPLDFSLSLVSAAANGLHYAHTRTDAAGKSLGIVHRDVTPANVMVGHDGGIKLIDFGIAMAASRTQKTQAGFVKGKVGYLTPEQVAGRDVDARTDVFALGVLLYELTTQQRAFRDASDLETMQRIKQGKVTRPTQLISDYPPELEAIVMRALQVDPRKRYADADAMRRAVEALGHRMRLVLGDAAVMEVMTQLFEPGFERPASLDDDPALDWVQSDHDMTVRRDPAELLEQMRAAEAKAKSAALPSLIPQERPAKKLRAATEAADAVVDDDADSSQSASMTAVALYAVDLPEYRREAQAQAARAQSPNVVTNVVIADDERSAGGSIEISLDTPTGLAAVPPTVAATVPPKPAKPPASPASSRRSAPQTSLPADPVVRFADKPVAVAAFGAGVTGQQRKGPPLRWIAAGIGAAAIAAAIFLATRGSSSSAADHPPAPAAARAVTPPPMPATKPAPPPAPTKVRLKIVTRPADATVMLDNKKLGKTPFDDEVDADPGKHNLKIRRHGYLTRSTDVTLDADVSQDVTLTPQK